MIKVVYELWFDFLIIALWFGEYFIQKFLKRIYLGYVA